jgi:predicted HD phosphohydrolase
VTAPRLELAGVLPLPAAVARRARARTAGGVVQLLGLLQSLEGVTGGLPIDQLTHALQTATRAERAGASREWVVAALVHDVGKAVSPANHPAIAAEMLRAHVADEIVQVLRHHQDLLELRARRLVGEPAGDVAWLEAEPWFALGRRFAEWDGVSFDPQFETPPLDHFAPDVAAVLGSTVEHAAVGPG